jgi:hypothetical protein
MLLEFGFLFLMDVIYGLPDFYLLLLNCMTIVALWFSGTGPGVRTARLGMRIAVSGRATCTSVKRTSAQYAVSHLQTTVSNPVKRLTDKGELSESREYGGE